MLFIICLAFFSPSTIIIVFFFNNFILYFCWKFRKLKMQQRKKPTISSNFLSIQHEAVIDFCSFLDNCSWTKNTIRDMSSKNQNNEDFISC